MEITIRIVVSFVVILVVGITMITISQDLLIGGRDTVENFNTVLPQDKLIEQDVFSPREILLLAQECLRINQGLLREELCYILRSEQPMTLEEEDVQDFGFIILPVDLNSRTLYLTYNMDNVSISD